jgi:hypothetical protein
MKVPSLDDRAVKVSAYLTDETFGYEHWRAAQFSSPGRDRFGVLMLFENQEARDAFYHAQSAAPREPK